MPDDLYDRDFYQWTQQQADVLRSLAATSNVSADWPHLIAEVESLGAGDRRAVSSRIGTIIECRMLLNCNEEVIQGTKEEDTTRRSVWIEAVIRARSEIDRLLRYSPSLRLQIAEMITEELAPTRRLVTKMLQRHVLYGELDQDTAGCIERFTITEKDILW